MTKYIGTTKGLIDWDGIIASFQPRTGDHNTVTSVVDRSEATAAGDSVLLGHYHEIISTWETANYDLTNIEWWDYYPGQHFDMAVQEKFADLVDADPRRVFVSEVMPGQCAPYHWDVEDHEIEWLAEGPLVRYVCFISQPHFGDVFILKDECFYLTEQHRIYEWDHYRDHHAGTNCGIYPQYLFHFLGKPRTS
jgi:hypothetical protein